MLPNIVPDRPQTKVAVDLFQLQNQYFLVTLDYFGNVSMKADVIGTKDTMHLQCETVCYFLFSSDSKNIRTMEEGRHNLKFFFIVRQQKHIT